MGQGSEDNQEDDRADESRQESSNRKRARVYREADEARKPAAQEPAQDADHDVPEQAHALAAQVITLTYLERRVQLATLRALGWSRAEVVKLLLGQAIGLGLIAAAISVAATTAVGGALSALSAVIVGAAFTALATALVTTGLAVVAPLSHAYAADLATGLRGE